jgi:WD40 repeat protein
VTIRKGVLAHPLAITGLAVLLVAGCAQSPQPSASGAALPVAGPSAAASAPGSSIIASGTPSPTVSNAPVPTGRIVFDRYNTAFGAEGDYLGSSIIAPDGTGEQTLPIPVQTASLNPVWAHDGSRLALNIWTPPLGPGRPALANADGSGFSPLQPNGVDGDLGCEDWSPDARSLLCWVSTPHPATGSRLADTDGIYTLRLRDLTVVQLTHSPYHDTTGSAGECGGGDGRAIFSPRGALIAFIRQRCGGGANPASDESAGMEIMSADGSDLRELVPQGQVRSHAGSQLSWSPDGNEIVFGSQDGHLFVVDVRSAQVSPIPLPASIGTSFASGPSWSPDGSRLVFSLYINADGSTDLYTVSPDGSDFERITSADGAEQFAQWGPAAKR